MKQEPALTHEFVEFIPEELKEGVLYVSTAYATVAHKCCCGCGREVVTPLSPTDWKLIFDGKTVTLDPSIGNWSFPCQSHYWIRGSRVRWAPQWSQERIAAGRAHDRFTKDQYFGGAEAAPESAIHDRPKPEAEGGRKPEITSGLWTRFRNWLGF